MFFNTTITTQTQHEIQYSIINKSGIIKKNKMSISVCLSVCQFIEI